MYKKLAITLFILMLIGVSMYLLIEGSNSKSTQASIGKHASSFSVTTTSGLEIDNASLIGKVVVITSSATWCTSCALEAQQFSSVFQKHDTEKVKFITIDMDPSDSVAAINLFKQTYNTPWAYTDAVGGAEIINKFEFDSLDMTFVLDRDGVIRYIDRSVTFAQQLEDEITKLL